MEEIRLDGRAAEACKYTRYSVKVRKIASTRHGMRAMRLLRGIHVRLSEPGEQKDYQEQPEMK